MHFSLANLWEQQKVYIWSKMLLPESSRSKKFDHILMYCIDHLHRPPSDLQRFKQIGSFLHLQSYDSVYSITSFMFSWCFLFNRSYPKKYFGGRAFILRASRLWNEFQLHIQDTSSVEIFKSRQKTHFFLCFGLSDFLWLGSHQLISSLTSSFCSVSELDF